MVARTRADLADALATAETDSAVVMTLGALHEGHLALIRAARRLVGADGRLIVTIFVNPLQFGPGEDYERYPRVFKQDVAACAAEGVNLVFAPSRPEMFPGGEPMVTVNPGPLAVELEGAARPTHFAGAVTIVAKLLNLIVPTYAIFGEKDYQQLTLIRRMVADLEMPYEIVGVPTVRESDGLALSSRNVYLSDAERKAAPALSAALAEGARFGTGGRSAVLTAARGILDRHPEVKVDYLELRSPDLTDREPQRGPARLLVAGLFGSTRLIDNVAVQLPG